LLLALAATNEVVACQTVAVARHVIAAVAAAAAASLYIGVTSTPLHKTTPRSFPPYNSL